MHFTWLEARQGQVRRQGASRFGMQRGVAGKAAIAGAAAMAPKVVCYVALQEQCCKKL